MPLFESFGDVALDGDDAAVTDTLITAMDPVRDRLADLFAAAINDELTGKGWAKAVAGTVLDCKNPVEQTFHEPFRAATTRSIEHTFPSLSVYREQSDHEEYLLAFLESLTDPSSRNLEDVVPRRVPSGLPVDN